MLLPTTYLIFPLSLTAYTRLQGIQESYQIGLNLFFSPHHFSLFSLLMLPLLLLLLIVATFSHFLFVWVCVLLVCVCCGCVCVGVSACVFLFFYICCFYLLNVKINDFLAFSKVYFNLNVRRGRQRRKGQQERERQRDKEREKASIG